MAVVAAAVADRVGVLVVRLLARVGEVDGLFVGDLLRLPGVGAGVDNDRDGLRLLVVLGHGVLLKWGTRARTDGRLARRQVGGALHGRSMGAGAGKGEEVVGPHAVGVGPRA